MEVKINRKSEITQKQCFWTVFKTVHFFRIGLRCSGRNIFLLRPYVGTETVSWMCILGAAPFALLGFVKYNGMTAEKFMWAWIKSEVLIPKDFVSFH